MNGHSDEVLDLQHKDELEEERQAEAEQRQADEEDHGFDVAKKYNPMGEYNPLKEVDKLVNEAKKISRKQQEFNNLMIGATPAQHKKMWAMAYSKGMNKTDIYKLQKRYTEKFKLWTFSDINQTQMSQIYKFLEQL